MDVPPAFARPLEEADLAPLPPGWTTGPPDFVGVGTPKAGSTWWWSLLQQHPRVVPNRARAKEVYAFHHLGWRAPDAADVARYHALFGRPPGGLVGEWTPSTLAHPFAVEALHACAPEARVLVMLRDPIDRFVSLLNQHLTSRAPLIGATGDGARVLKVHSLFPGAAHLCRVAPELTRLLELYGRERVLVLQYEAAKRDPAAALARTQEFLGLEPFTPHEPERAVNRRPYAIERPTPAERARIAGFFADEVAALDAMDLGLDLDLWPDFARKSRVHAIPDGLPRKSPRVLQP